jgi:hypothetical protein
MGYAPCRARTNNENIDTKFIWHHFAVGKRLELVVGRSGPDRVFLPSHVYIAFTDFGDLRQFFEGIHD